MYHSNFVFYSLNLIQLFRLGSCPMSSRTLSNLYFGHKITQNFYFIRYLFKCFTEVDFILTIHLCVFKISFFLLHFSSIRMGHHPCDRQCRRCQTPRTCIYNFTIEWYLTLSKVKLFHTFLTETLASAKNIYVKYILSEAYRPCLWCNRSYITYHGRKSKPWMCLTESCLNEY